MVEEAAAVASITSQAIWCIERVKVFLPPEKIDSALLYGSLSLAVQRWGVFFELMFIFCIEICIRCISTVKVNVASKKTNKTL